MGSSFHPPCALYRFNHLKIAEELHCGYEAAQFWRLTCALYRFNHLKIAEELHCGYEALSRNL